MLRRIGLPLLALGLLLMFVAPTHANAKVHFGIFVGPAYPGYYPYAYPYPPYAYDPYYYGPYGYYPPYVYSYPNYGYWGGGYYWGRHRDRDDYRGWGHGGQFRGGARAYHGGGRGYVRGRGR